MSWRRIEPRAKTRVASQRDAVAVGMSAGGGHRVPCISITLRRDMLGRPALLADGARVSVLWGEGEQAGLIRLVPGEDFAMYRPGGKRPAPDVLVLRFPAPPGVAASARAPHPVAYFRDGDAIEITLPAWACPTRIAGATPQPAMPVLAAMPTGNATPPGRAQQLAAAAAAEARRRAGR